ncbi:MAG: hypothetical protein V4726_00315 [Verrucomicrobiota bacterium]
MRLFLTAVGCLLCASAARAQYDLKAGNFNHLWLTPPPAASNTATTPATALSNFQSMAPVAASAGPISTSSVLAERYPANAGKTQILKRGTLGAVFVSGVPRYAMGDVITSPLTQIDGITPAPAGYWRVGPLAPGEAISGSVNVTSSTGSPSVTVTGTVPSTLMVGSTLLGGTVTAISGATVTLNANANTALTSAAASFTSTPLPLGSVNVTSASTDSTRITVASVPVTLVTGATLLGQPVTAVSGTTVTLAGEANANVTSSTPSAIIPPQSFYYSPHAEKVFATQPGRASLIWITQQADSGRNYGTKLDEFAVSSTSNQPVRTIYWTESSFDGPRVQISDGRILTANPIYNAAVPKAVASEVEIPGYLPTTPNLTTLSYDRLNSVGQLHAYNVEGRIFVEYLGRQRTSSQYEFVGYDVVDLVRVPSINYTTVNLGRKIIPHDNDSRLRPTPVFGTTQSAVTYYGTSIQPDGSFVYYAERETGVANTPDDGSPASADAFNKVVMYWMDTGSFGIQWPKFQDRYWLRWSPGLNDYAHYTVDASGSTPATGLPFTTGSLPAIVYQDDPAQAEALIDPDTQRLTVDFADGADNRNRTLLKFTSGASLWYVNLYTQAEDRQTVLSSTSTGVTITVNSTSALEVGMVVTGTGIPADTTVTITKIINGTTLQLSSTIPAATNPLTYTVQEDGLRPIDATVTVGSRINAPAGHETAGYITSGTAYYPAGYLNPFTSGVAAAGAGAIIPVNALPGGNVLNIRWFRKNPAPSAEFRDFYVPGKMGRYTASWPADTTPGIIIAQGVGTGDLPAAEAAGSVYTQNDSAQPGYNPNEEHAFMIGGRAYALRDDLNVPTFDGTVPSGATRTSPPFVLVAYTDPADSRPAIHAYKVRSEDDTHTFSYSAVAGNLLVKPYPLPLMPQPLAGTGAARTSKDIEILTADQPADTALNSDPAYNSFTFQDRKGFTWVHRGPHGNPDSPGKKLSMKLYYPSRAGFFVPGLGEVAEGTILPFLRNSARNGSLLNLTAIDKDQTDEPRLITYNPAWPANAPELRVGETLTLAKFGLPQVRGQTSARIYYQQSLAKPDPVGGDVGASVILHDPTREKTVALDATAVGLSALPSAILTTSQLGKTYFQGLPPHLQQRFYLDPLRGAAGTLVLKGVFHDEAAGEDYLDLDVLTAREVTQLKNLVPSGADQSKWAAAIDALTTTVETFKPDPAKFGAYIVDTTKTVTTGPSAVAAVSSSDTAVDSYALTATGKGAGYVTMVFGDGRAFTPEGDPVQVQVFKVARQLYTGDLKVVSSSNPLDEQVTLRHSGDFAGKPEDYEFQWRWATGEASAPAAYSTVLETKISTAQSWDMFSDPNALDHPASDGVVQVQLPRSVVMRPATYTSEDAAAGFPGLFLQLRTFIDFGPDAYPLGIPDNIVFSATVGQLDGFVLYVNGQAALAYNAPTQPFPLTNASSGLSASGLVKQFRLPPGVFTAGDNIIAVGLYTTSDANVPATVDFRLEAARETDLVASASNAWQDPLDTGGINTNTAIVGGSPANPFGGSIFVLNDRWFTMRYRPKASAGSVLGTPWSRWMPPQFVEGWVKRVLAAINPFEQRVKDLYNNQTDSTVSVLTQAGTRWEGNIALTLDNINDAGLISIYETVFNRARSLSIDANTNDPDSNNALLLASGYLNDLYTILGNEAYADAANPTISLDDTSTATEVNTSRFSFEGQVATSLEEEMALLRGRDDAVSPGARTAPAYNRLYWNYTRGINSGEVLYAVNYNIKEQAGTSTANGVVDETDAQRMFPQGHGDAYGHYLTALTNYYRLLTNDNFTWTPRAESVTVLGQSVTVDFTDERKFAAAAGNVARTAAQVIALAHRQAYQDDPAAGWSQFRDRTPVNTSTGVTSHQGMDEWVSRGSQGAFLNWAVANAILPAEDNYHSGVRKIDRATVPELSELPTQAAAFQSAIDNANAHLNPLGLSPDAIAFDLSPADLKAGISHFEQISGRALKSLNNAAGAFNQAAVMTRSLRNQQNTVDDYSVAIADQETAYSNQLIDIFGRPYSAEIGAGKTYAQDYAGPDLFHWFIVDRASDLIDTTQTFTVSVAMPLEYKTYNQFFDEYDMSRSWANDRWLNQHWSDADFESTKRTVTVNPSQYVQYNNVWQPGGLGSRAETGELQDALQETQRTWLALSAAGTAYKNLDYQLTRKADVLKDLLTTIGQQQSNTGITNNGVHQAKLVMNSYLAESGRYQGLSQLSEGIAAAVVEAFPRVVGLAYDATSTWRSVTKYAMIAGQISFAITSGVYQGRANGEEAEMLRLKQNGELMRQVLEGRYEATQQVYEFETLYRDCVSHGAELEQLTLAHLRALQEVTNVLARGNRVLAERGVFRQRAAAVIQGYRTKDVAFRLFRDESLEQYRSLFDLASRYTYLAAKSYDYETGLLGTAQGRKVFSSIVSSRALGDLAGGVPQSTVSSLGDAGLAGSMAKLNADFSVAKGRLGINNPDQNGTVFSLRQELFRLLNDDTKTDDDQAWQQALEQHIVSNLMNDSDAATYCRNLKRSDGGPVPGIIIPFSTTIHEGLNFFGLPLAGGDHNYTTSNFATKIFSAGMVLKGYYGMDPYVQGTPNAGSVSTGNPDILSATPYLYLIPTGTDTMLAPPLGDTSAIRSWQVRDQALPLPFNLGASDFNSVQFFNANGTLSEQPWILRKHQAFRAVNDPAFFYSTVPTEFTSSRLIGRSVWNSGWKIVIPAYTLLNNEQEGLNRFVRTVKDIQIFLRTYSHSGN